MKSLANYTNGYIILADSFNMSIFKQSFQRVFVKDEAGDLQMGFNATFDVQVRRRRLLFAVCDQRGLTFAGHLSRARRPAKSSRCRV